jgi:NAD(P)H-hydrate epimerase
MNLFLSRDDARNLDRRAVTEFGMLGAVLMENAGRGAAEVLLSLGIHGRVVVCCGKGNNGGDGFVLARHLDYWRIPVRILLFAAPEKLTGAAELNYRVVARSGLPVTICGGPEIDHSALASEFASAEWIVDALFGTGLIGPVRKPFDAVIRGLNSASARVFALDIPSGLDADTGAATEPTVRAAHTATFAALKKGFANAGAQDWLGQVHLVDIGMPRVLINVDQPGENA